MLDKAKRFFLNIISYFDKEETLSPIGLKSLGLRAEYLNSVYKNHFSAQKFTALMISPVQERPLYFGT